MRILITGATGYIGRQLAESLSREHEISATVREHSRHLEPPIVQHSGFDMLADNDWSTALLDIDAVVYLAGKAHITRSTNAEIDSEYMAINCDAAIDAAKAAAEHSVKRFIYISSVSVNGEQSAQPFCEADMPNPVGLYGQSKYAAELKLFQLSKESDIEIVVIRPPMVVGPNAQGNVGRIVKWASRRIVLPLPLGSTGNKRSVIGLSNLVAFITICLSHPRAVNEVFFVADEADLSTTQLLKYFAIAFHKKPIMLQIPPFIMRAGLTMIGKSHLSKRLFGDFQVNTSKARDLLGWRPGVSLKDQCEEIYKADKRIAK
jgi:nucleoside-diphosphate-sugar epimerase